MFRKINKNGEFFMLYHTTPHIGLPNKKYETDQNAYGFISIKIIIYIVGINCLIYNCVRTVNKV